MTILIQNGHVIDPLTGRDEVCDVLVRDGKIQKIGTALSEEAEQVLDASGCYVMPGLIDLHVHFRDPGLEYKETLETGARAAARGGVTTVCAMPNTRPVIDTAEKVADVHARAKKDALVHVIQIGAVTRGQEGKELADIAGMAREGCHAISEDGKSVMNASLYRKGMREAKANGLAVFAHCEDITMVEGGVMNADENAARLGLKGITNSVEDVIVARDILLAKETGVRLHLCHCSTADSVEMIRLAKEEGLPVTGEVCPHHFTLSADDIRENDGNYKMNPPLRSKADVEALKKRSQRRRYGRDFHRSCASQRGRKESAHGEGSLWHRGTGDFRSAYLYGTGKTGDFKYHGYGGKNEPESREDPGIIRPRKHFRRETGGSGGI